MLRACRDASRRRLLAGSGAACLLGFGGPPARAAAAGWPLWQQFCERFLQPDGRVVDHSVAEKHSTSEGQSYGMFFALVANDRPAFDRLWAWSLDNLAPRGVDKQLPAWRWGRKPDGSWGVMDANPASDADLWFAYSLLEAERLWQEPRFGQQARQLLNRVRQDEVVNVPGLGAMLLPGVQGFHPQPDLWRFNPSYSVLPQLRRFAQVQPDGPWAELASNSVRLIEASSPRGFVPDWVGYKNGDGFIADPQSPDTSSYDAIRCFLWAGITAERDPLAARTLRAIGGLRNQLKLTGELPEKVAAATGQASGQAPAGFYAAAVPYLDALGEPLLRNRCLGLLDAAGGAQRDRPERPWLYYDHVLALFALGHAQRRYRFSPEGQLQRGTA